MMPYWYYASRIRQNFKGGFDLSLFDLTLSLF